MYVCMYACMHVYACIHVCVCIYACMYVCMYAYMHVCMQLCCAAAAIDVLLMCFSTPALVPSVNDHGCWGCCGDRGRSKTGRPPPRPADRKGGIWALVVGVYIRRLVGVYSESTGHQKGTFHANYWKGGGGCLTLYPPLSSRGDKDPRRLPKARETPL